MKLEIPHLTVSFFHTNQPVYKWKKDTHFSKYSSNFLHKAWEGLEVGVLPSLQNFPSKPLKFTWPTASISWCEKILHPWLIVGQCLSFNIATDMETGLPVSLFPDPQGKPPHGNPLTPPLRFLPLISIMPFPSDLWSFSDLYKPCLILGGFRA